MIDTCKRLQREGFEVTYLTPSKDGLVTPEQVVAAMTDKTLLVNIMFANNEIGVIQPMEAIGAAIKVKNPKTLFHSDAVQAAGKVPVDVERCKLDLVSLTAHKMYGPKGVGALWVRRKPRVRIDPLLDGGGHERGMRSGTLAVPLIVGFGKACEICQSEMEAEAIKLGTLRDCLYRGLTARCTETYVKGSMAHRLPGNLNISFAFVEGESLLMALKNIAVSSGSACTSASVWNQVTCCARWALAMSWRIPRFGLASAASIPKPKLTTLLIWSRPSVERLRRYRPCGRCTKMGLT